jgi:hypothetical protein
MTNPEAQQQDPDRVRRHTDPEILTRIEQDLERSINFYSTQPSNVLTARIEELEREWDMERALGTNAATLALTGAFFGTVVGRKWFLLSIGVMGFLMQHALMGWCPPVPVMRRLGVRTRGEIDREKFALKALRGDFKDLPKPQLDAANLPGPQVLQTVNE